MPFTTSCPACKPLTMSDGKLKSQWTGCPYCNSVGIVGLDGYIRYLTDFYRQEEKDITLRVMRFFGVRL